MQLFHRNPDNVNLKSNSDHKKHHYKTSIICQRHYKSLLKSIYILITHANLDEIPSGKRLRHQT